MKDNLKNIIEKYRGLSYSELLNWVSSSKIEVKNVKTINDQEIQVELTAFWDNKDLKTIRFMASSKNNTRRSKLNIFRSDVTESFIKAPDGSFIGD